MRKRRWIYAVAACLCCTLMLTAFAGCGSSHKITVAEGEDLLGDCPKSAKAGEIVTIETCAVCDADLYLSVNGDVDFGKFVEDCVYEFEMPDEDVVIKVWVISNGLADKNADNLAWHSINRNQKFIRTAAL